MKKLPNPKPLTLRQKAEESLKKKVPQIGTIHSDPDTLKLIQELEVHQIELEIQNNELMQANEQVDAASRKYTELFDFAPSGYYTLAKEGNIVWLNLCGASMLGKERRLLVNSQFVFFVSDDSKTTFNLFLEKIFKNSVKETCEVMLKTQAASPIWIYLSGIATEDGAQCLVNAIDISEQKQNEKELRFRGEIIENMSEGVAMHKVIYNRDGKETDYLIYDANPAYEKHTGISNVSIINKCASEIYGTGEPPYMHEFGTVARTGVPFTFETYFPPLKKHFHISVFAPLPGHFVTVFVDITQSKIIQEELKTACEEREVLLKEVHHRVKNNLQAIILLIEKQLDVIPADESKHFLIGLKNQAYTMALIYDQLNSSKKLSKIEMFHFFEELSSNVGFSLGRVGSFITTIEVADVWMDVNLATPCALIVNELITNVYKYAFPVDNKENHLLIKLKKVEETYFLTVKDNGCGLPEDFDAENLQSSGLKLVSLWATHQLGGNFQIIGNKGVEVQISFPDRKHREQINGMNE